MTYVYSSCENVLDHCNFLGTPENNRFLGMELEFSAENPQQVAGEVLDILGRDYAIFKWEGQDLELVTAPASIEVHRERIARLEEWRRPRGTKSWKSERCGMHIHVSRTALQWNNRNGYSYRKFIERPENAQLVDWIAGRAPNHWCRRGSYNPEAYSNETYWTLDETYVGSKSAAVEFNRDTYETRIFQSTLNPRRITANLEFVDSVVAYLNTAPPTFDYVPYLTWLNGTNYTALRSTLRRARQIQLMFA